MALNYGRTDAAKMAWMVQFAAAITATPPAYGLTTIEAATIQSAVDTASAAFDLAGSTNRTPNDPTGRTSPNIGTMRTAMIAALSLCISYGNNILNNAGVANGDIIAAGMVPKATGRTPRLVPATAPLLSIISAESGIHRFRFSDSDTPDTRAKPAGAVGLQLFTKVGVAPAVTPDGADFYAAFTSNGRTLTALGPIVAYDPADAGKVATLFGRWVGSRGDVGPWSLPVSMNIAF